VIGNVLIDSHSEDVVLLKFEGGTVAEVPLLNLVRFGIAKTISRLKFEIVGSEESRIFWTLDLPGVHSARGVQQWASWLTHRDLRAVAADPRDRGWTLRTALDDAEAIADIDYQDALMDAWKSWVDDGAHPNVDRLRHQAFQTCPSSIEDLFSAMVLRHDIEAGLLKDGEALVYSDKIREKVRVLAVSLLSRHERVEIKNPLELSEDEFCQEHHAHNKLRQLCYKVKRMRPWEQQ